MVIDTLMTGRLHQANFYFEKYGISLLGNNVNADLNSIYTDNILDIPLFHPHSSCSL